MNIHSSGKALGASIEGIDLAQPISDSDFKQILRALGEHGVLCFPEQRLETAEFARFGRMFGELEINVANQFHEPGFPEVMVLSNMTENGKPIGLGDAGQGWHTDMSYSKEIALANVLYAIKVPARDGRPLGDTQFRNMHAAYEDLPGEIKSRLEGRTATHDFAKFWDMMRARPGSQRTALTPEQRAKKPPVSQPIFRTHPITGRTVLYCNPGYAIRIDGMPEAVADRLARAARVRTVRSGAQVIRQGDRGDEFFVIADGRASILVRSRGEDQLVGHYTTGDFFGERALLGGGVRAATILADTPLKLLVFSRDLFWTELAGPIGWQARVRQALEERQRLQAVPLFKGLGERQLDILAVKLETRPFAPGEVLVRQGDDGDSFYVVREGQVDVTRQDGRTRRKLASLKAGDYFGEMALLYNQPRMATVAGNDTGSVWRLGRQDFRDLIGRYLDLEGPIARKARSRRLAPSRGRR